MNKLQDHLVGRMPNTYTMTKRCSEDLVNHRAHCLPAGIFRPPIGNGFFIFVPNLDRKVYLFFFFFCSGRLVLSTYKEPVAGWTDNLCKC